MVVVGCGDGFVCFCYVMIWVPVNWVMCMVDWVVLIDSIDVMLFTVMN